MNLKRFRAHDLVEINEWYSFRQMPIWRSDMVPKIGYFVPGVAAGFLYQMDCSLCMLDGFISSPLAEGHERARALDLITDALLSDADQLEFHSVLAMTKNESIRARCRKYHFAPKGEYHVYVRGV